MLTKYTVRTHTRTQTFFPKYDIGADDDVASAADDFIVAAMMRRRQDNDDQTLLWHKGGKGEEKDGEILLPHLTSALRKKQK